MACLEYLCLPKWRNEVHSKSLTKSEENGPSTSIVINNVLSPYQPKLDANTIWRSMTNTSEEFCRVPFHVLRTPKVSAMFSKCINMGVPYRDAQLSSKLNRLTDTNINYCTTLRCPSDNTGTNSKAVNQNEYVGNISLWWLEWCMVWNSRIPW